MNDIDPKNPLPPPPPQKHWDRFLSLLPYLGVAVLALIGLGLAAAIVWGLFKHDSIVRELANADLARGVITFIFAVGTIGIALLLTFGALVGKNTVEEFTKAKEVLTLLMGVFGTILGFYFGTSTGEASHKLSISSPATEASADGKTVTMLAYVSGGDPPFIYNITFDKNALTSIPAQTSADGWIREVIDTTKIDATKIGTSPLGYTISVTDAHRNSVEHRAADKERITVKEAPQ
jgi:hypothetical protein